MAQHSRAKSIILLAKENDREVDFIENSCSKSCERNRSRRSISIHPSFLRVKRKIDFDLPNNDDKYNTESKKKKLDDNSHDMDRQQKEIKEDDNDAPMQQEEYFYKSIIPPRPAAVLVDQDDVTGFESTSLLMTLETVPSASKPKTFILGMKDGVNSLEISKENTDFFRARDPEKAVKRKVFIITNDLVKNAQQAMVSKEEKFEENYMNRQETEIKEDDNETTKQQEEYFYASITPPRPAAVLVDQDDVTCFESPSVLTTLETVPSASKSNTFSLGLNDGISTLDLSNENTSCPEEGCNVCIFSDQQAINGPDGDDVLQGQSRKSRPKKGRKLKYDSQNRMTRKINVIQNKSYYTQKGSFKEAKEFRQYICKCDCINTIGVETAQREFQKYYSVDSHAAQRALICAMVTEAPIKRKRKRNSTKKTCTRLYKIDEKQVCKMFFVQTFRISSAKITIALKCKKRPEGIKDLRGIGGGHNKTRQAILKAVIHHIQKFPKYKSHYRRAQTEIEYLAPHTTLKVMYNCYKEEHIEHERVSEATYKKVFYINFNLRRKKLKKDTCNTCDKLEVSITNESGAKKDNFIKEKNEHCEKAESVRKAMNKDIKNSKSDPETEVLTFDLEKTLPMPRIPTNIVFYLRQLWLYNAGIYSGKSNKSFCYVWVEGEAGRGAQEVGSCLRKHILSDQFPTVKNLILWSDSCGGQNRNIKIVLMMKAILEEHPTLQKITLNYLIPGHSYLQNDNDFGDVEKALKLQQRLYTPQDYMNVMASCRTKNPLKTIKMDKTDFISTEEMEKAIVNRKKDSMGEKVNWLKIRQIEVTKDHPFKINVKTTVSEEEESVEIDVERKKGRKGHTCFKDMIKPLWPNGKPVSEKKLKDLKSLFPYIPNDAMAFYKNLVTDDTIDDDIEGFDGHLDFDPEYVEEE